MIDRKGGMFMRMEVLRDVLGGRGWGPAYNNVLLLTGRL